MDIKNLENLLKNESCFLSSDGKLLKSKIKECALKYDNILIDLLINSEFKELFFEKLQNDIWIFKQKTFIDYIDDKNFLLDSYTKFSNKIGLSVSNKFLSRNDDVVLSFPFKDCVLKGDQSKDDDKSKEIFFNEILARDEINRLFDKKVLVNFKKFTARNQQSAISAAENFLKFSRNSELNRARNLPLDTICDNLIIKGNNLLALHTLKSNFAGRVKLIYIDPPYNTGNDSFNYNDSFNHSTWLTFMKNRLEIAREFLRDDGVIFVQCDDNEQAYLKVLMDEIFGRENFVVNFIWNHRKSGQNDIDFTLSHNYTLTYAKNRQNFRLNRIDSKIEGKFSNPDNDPRGNWTADPFDAPDESANCNYPIKNPNTNEIFYPPKGRHWRFSKDKFDEVLADNRIVFGKTGKSKPQYKRFQFEAEQRGENVNSIWLDCDTATRGTQEIQNLFESKIFSTPKPEALLKRIIEISTQPNDIVMDFFLGSGTTAAVAHKMNRQYIGIEQMDYIESVSVERLKKVIEGEQGGVSKTLNWQGGGEFIYFELAKFNQNFMDKILGAKAEDILNIYDEICEKAFLNYDADSKILKDKKDDFKEFNLAEQKEFLLNILNKNMLYVNLDDIEDENYEISQKDKELNKDFYNE